MQNSKVKESIIIGMSIVLGLSFLGYSVGRSLIRFKEYERTITVKGLAEKDVPANVAIWPIQFKAADNDLSLLYSSLEKNRQGIVSFLLESGFKQEEISISQLSVTDKYASEYDSNNSIKMRYIANQTVTVYTTNVQGVISTKGKIDELTNKGIVVVADNYDNKTEYIFTKLNEIKPLMVEEATINARQVALKFSKDSNSKLGKIKDAQQGQFSINDRDKNTPHIKKVRVVSTIQYYLSD